MSHRTDNQTILLTGKNGQVGWELKRSLALLGNVVAVDIQDCDLCNTDDIRNLVRRVNPTLIVNPAAYTAVDKAESEQTLAHAVNAVAPGVLAEEAKKIGAPIIHYSTDYVFDGTKKEPYNETDEPNPTTVYGKTKRDGEKAVEASGARHVILRLAWVYGMRGNNFVLTMLRLAKEKKEIRVVEDQVGSPSWSRMIAEATALIANEFLNSQDTKNSVFHLPSGDSTSWYNFAKAIFSLGEHRFFANKPKVVPISTSEYPTPAPRPAYSVLQGDKVKDVFGISMPSWQDQLELSMLDAASTYGTPNAS